MPLRNLLSLHEAIVIALINQPSRRATFDDIAKFIDDRNLYPERKGNISLATQVMLRSTKAKEAYHHLFEEIGAGYIRLRDSYAGFPLQLKISLEAILEHNQSLFQPKHERIRMFDIKMNNHRYVEMYTSNIVCIMTQKKDAPSPKRRTSTGEKKFIYLKETDLNGKEVIGIYNINNSLSSLVKYFDPLNYFLAVVSDSVIVNVAFFKIGTSKVLKTNLSFPEILQLPTIGFSTSPAAKKNLQIFQLIQQSFMDRISLEKSILSCLQNL